MKALDVMMALLLVVGGLNWGLVGLAQFDLVAAVFGGPDAVPARVVYGLVGVAAVYQALALRAIQSRWMVGRAAA
jgi:hypothetical protein